MDWVHCNFCFKQPSNSLNLNLFLTNCGHMFCDLCIRPESPNECKICKKPCSIKKLTSADMTPDIREYFGDRVELIEKAIKACKFQKGHRLNLARGYSELNYTEKYNKLKLQIQKSEARRTELRKRARELEQKIERYQKMESSPATSSRFNFTPRSIENESPFFNSKTRNNQDTPQTVSATAKFYPTENQFRRPMMSATSFSESSAKSTPNSIESKSHYFNQSTSNSSFKTPKCSSVLKNLKINETKSK